MLSVHNNHCHNIINVGSLVLYMLLVYASQYFVQLFICYFIFKVRNFSRQRMQVLNIVQCEHNFQLCCNTKFYTPPYMTLTLTVLRRYMTTNHRTRTSYVLKLLHYYQANLVLFITD